MARVYILTVKKDIRGLAYGGSPLLSAARPRDTRVPEFVLIPTLHTHYTTLDGICQAEFLIFETVVDSTRLSQYNFLGLQIHPYPLRAAEPTAPPYLPGPESQSRLALAHPVETRSSPSGTRVLRAAKLSLSFQILRL